MSYRVGRAAPAALALAALALASLALAALALAALPAPACGADLGAQVDAYRRGHEAAIVEELAALTRLKSVAADSAGLAATAAYLQQALQQRGFETRLLSTAGASAPVVFGTFKAAGRGKHAVVFYAHYDGQPVTPSQWNSDPFTPVLRRGSALTDAPVDWRTAAAPFDPEWRLYARAASDDKASIVAFLAAFDALKAAHRKPSVDLKVIWEGEEEAGSAHLADILRGNRDSLAADLFIIGDGPVHQSRRPMVYFGARGTLSLQATVYGPIKALHDGHYGNWAPNPAAMAAHLIAALRDDEGKILIPDFDADVRPLNPAELAALRALPAVDDELKREFGLGRSEGTQSLAASLMRPALNIRGMRAGQIGADAANAIPVDAVVSMDWRLVPDQSPAGVRLQLEQFLAADGWTVVHSEPDLATRLAHPRIVKLEWGDGYPALRSDMNSPQAKAVIAAASLAAHAPVVVLPMLGASVPLYIFADVFHVPIVCLPIVNHDNNQHAANENLRLKNLWDGIGAYAAMMTQLNW